MQAVSVYCVVLMTMVSLALSVFAAPGGARVRLAGTLLVSVIVPPLSVSA